MSRLPGGGTATAFFAPVQLADRGTVLLPTGLSTTVAFCGVRPPSHVRPATNVMPPTDVPARERPRSATQLPGRWTLHTRRVEDDDAPRPEREHHVASPTAPTLQRGSVAPAKVLLDAS